MLLIDLPLPTRVQSPRKQNLSFQGKQGDSWLFNGEKDRIELLSEQVEYKSLTYAEADQVIAATESFFLNQPARLKFENKLFFLTGDFLNETWFNDTVTLKLSLTQTF